jgi:NADH:ubiquinone oxidoreductase subunit E
MQIHDFLEQDPLFRDRIVLTTGKCFQEACKPDQAPVVSVDGVLIKRATLDQVLAAIREKLA